MTRTSTVAADESLAGIAVRTRALTRRFGSFVAVDAIDLDVHGGEIFGFLGANGAGKTTAIRMLCGLLLPTSGEGWVDGLTVSRQSAQIKLRIGYMSQKFSLYGDLTVEENLTFYGGIYGLKISEIRERSTALFERLGLGPLRKSMTGALPLGYKQRLALGCAVLHQPRIVFLDEPTGGVDPVARREFWNLIYELADAGSTIFVTTHYMDEAEYCGRVSIMDRGKIIALGSPRELKQQVGAESMQQVFLALINPATRDE
jgi:ABC-2 type transport system ATP-binding protein